MRSSARSMSGSDGFNACARRSSFSPLSRSPIWHSIRPSFLCKIRLDGAVAAQLDRFLKLTDRFGQSCAAPGPAHPNASLVAVAGHEARGLLEIRGFDGFCEAPERLHVVGFYCECLSPGGNGVLGLRLALETMSEHVPRHTVAGLQLDDVLQQRGRRNCCRQTEDCGTSPHRSELGWAHGLSCGDQSDDTQSAP